MATSAVQITDGTDTYVLFGTTIAISYDRNPIYASPGAGQDPLIEDLGFFRATVTLLGTIESNPSPTTDGGIDVASKADLEQFNTDNWENEITLSIMDTASTYSYVGAIKQVKFTQDGGKQDRWEFTLQLLSKKVSIT